MSGSKLAAFGAALVVTAGFGLGLGMNLATAQDPKGAAATKGADSDFKDLRQKASYGLGVRVGKSLLSQSADIDTALFARGLTEALEGKPSKLTDQQIQDTLVAFQKEMIEKKSKEGETFLAENKKKPGVKTLESGLQYKVLKDGTGKVPKATDNVTVNYEGRLIDNTVFDSSANHGGPASFQVGGVIKGFSEALQHMKAGSKWQVYIPAGLAYGASPPPGSKITPNAPLIFDLELVEVKEAK